MVADLLPMLLILALLLVPTGLHALWLSPGERAHKAEFTQAWQQRFGSSSEPPVAMLKTWFRQWKRTSVAPGPWLDANVGQPPAGGPTGAGGVPGGTNT